MKIVQYEPLIGTFISTASEIACAQARRLKARVEFDFNGLRLYATPKRCAASLVWDYYMWLDRLLVR